LRVSDHDVTKILPTSLATDRTILKYIFPMTDAPEFKAIYPVFVVTLGVLAASRLDGIRSTVVAVALVCIATGAVTAIVRDRQKITLQHAWNVLFVSYYRPFGISLTQRVSHAGHNPAPVDLLTYSTGDFIKSLADAAADFAQVSASGIPTCPLRSASYRTL
jgi:hypothetical protein